MNIAVLGQNYKYCSTHIYITQLKVLLRVCGIFFSSIKIWIMTYHIIGLKDCIQLEFDVFHR